MNDRSKLFLALFILLATIGLGVWQWNVSEALKIDTNTLNTNAANLSIAKTELTENYQELKAEVNETRKSDDLKLSTVFPEDEDLTELTRIFDDFELKNNFESNPFFVSKISYESSQISEQSNYRYVPLNLSFTASKKNMSKFIEFIETSGSIEGEVRLMSIESMKISYPAEYGGTYEVDLKLNAYFSREL